MSGLPLYTGLTVALVAAVVLGHFLYTRLETYLEARTKRANELKLAVASIVVTLDETQQQAVNVLLLATRKNWAYVDKQLKDYPDVAKAVRREVAKRATQA